MCDLEVIERRLRLLNPRSGCRMPFRDRSPWSRLAHDGASNTALAVLILLSRRAGRPQARAAPKPASARCASSSRSNSALPGPMLTKGRAQLDDDTNAHHPDWRTAGRVDSRPHSRVDINPPEGPHNPIRSIW